MRRPAFIPVLAATLLLTAGCAVGSAGDPFAGEAGEGSIQIEVLNLNFADATLYALRMGQRIRMGTVTGKQSETFTVRWPNSVPLRVEIRLLGGERCVTREMVADPGDEIYMEVAQQLSRDPDCSR